MEKEEAPQEDKKRGPRTKRHLSLFPRRRKAEIRPFVREKRKLQYRKYAFYLIGFVFLIFALSAVLYVVRVFIVPKIFIKNEAILTPAGTQKPNEEQIRQILASNVQISDIAFATESAVVKFALKEKTTVYLSSEKNIQTQLDLIEAIDRQLTSDGKQAIFIDLRYNKPIVKF